MPNYQAFFKAVLVDITMVTLCQDEADSHQSPGSGRALRTGRTAETYSEARQLSAKQRGGIPSKRLVITSALKQA